jgi:hypothetical protein
MTQPTDWSQVLHDALGADAEQGFKASPPRILQNPWVELSEAHWKEGQSASPWNYAMPGGDWNMVTFYRKRTTPSGSNRGQEYKFQVFRGFIRFYDGGESSAARQAQQLVKLSQTAINEVDQNRHLDAQSFRAASDLFFNVMSRLETYGETRLRSLANEISTEGSNFDGTAGDAFGGPGVAIPGLGLGGLPGAGSSVAGVRGSVPNSRGGSLIGGLGDEPGSALPSPTPLSPTGLSGAGFSRLSPGNNAGVAIGPLGTPPPGYTGPGPLPGVPAGARTRALAGGGYGPGGVALDGLASNAAGAQSALAQNGVKGPAGANGYGASPFFPPMMGGGMGGQGAEQARDKERERTTWLAEDEEVWGTDPDCVPAVVGRDEGPDGVPGEPAKRPSTPRTPAGPKQPARTGQSSTGRRDT